MDLLDAMRCRKRDPVSKSKDWTGSSISAERRCAGTRRERHSDHSQTSVTTMKNQTHTGAALPQPRLVRPLEVGCVVTTNGGKKHTIAEIGFGGSEGVAEHPFYHWDKDWPYEIEHAAMNPETDAIVSVSWPSTACCVSYSTLPLESDQTFETRAWTYKFPDGRKVTTAIAKDGSNEGMWFRITKQLEDGKESELKFRLSLEAAAVLAQLIDYALDYPHNAEVSHGDRQRQPDTHSTHNQPEAKHPASAGCHPTTCSPWSDAPETLHEWRKSETLRPDPRSKRMANHAVKLERERNALREQMRENPWCSACREPDCCVSMDGTCAMIRKYLSQENETSPSVDAPEMKL